MTEQISIDDKCRALREVLQRYDSILNDPEPGLWTYRDACYRLEKEIVAKMLTTAYRDYADATPKEATC